MCCRFSRSSKILPDVRQDKVAKLRKQIEQGSYKVDADRIAERMLEEALKDILYRTGKNAQLIPPLSHPPA